jgi:hypothetical protein
VSTIVDAIRNAVSAFMELDAGSSSLRPVYEPDQHACEAKCPSLYAAQLERVRQVLADGGYTRQTNTLQNPETKIVTATDSATKVVLGVALTDLAKSDISERSKLRVHALAVVSSKRGNGIASRCLVPVRGLSRD